MTQIALIIKHRTLPGKREAVRLVWERHMAPAIAAHPGHTAYFYTFDTNDPEVIYAFQEYVGPEASRAFLETAAYAAYTAEVEPLLAEPPQVISLGHLADTRMAKGWGRSLRRLGRGERRLVWALKPTTSFSSIR